MQTTIYTEKSKLTSFDNKRIKQLIYNETISLSRHYEGIKEYGLSRRKGKRLIYANLKHKDLFIKEYKTSQRA